MKIFFLTSKTATIVFSYRRAIMAEIPTPGQPRSLVCTESDAQCGGILRQGENPNSGARLQESRATAVGGKPLLVCNPSKLTR